MDRLADAQVKALAIDTDHVSLWFRGKPCPRNVMGDRLAVVIVHMLEHATLGSVSRSERVGRCDSIQPVDRAEPADEAPAHRLQCPEIEIVRAVIVTRLRKISVIAFRCEFDDLRIDNDLRFGQQGQPAGCLNIFSAALTHEKRTASVSLEILRMLRDPADEYQRPAMLVQAIGHRGSERKAGHTLRMGREHATVFLEQ